MHNRLRTHFILQTSISFFPIPTRQSISHIALSLTLTHTLFSLSLFGSSPSSAACCLWFLFLFFSFSLLFFFVHSGISLSWFLI
ncbi:uncharacterized protein EI90DRAFT_3050477 [Cantharellus anzutake]|uniref:uncharacterized protein n=1 Tax=Cantharellus anzutake TaxID=1750568 RepID=UPI001907E85C|nr:uncharacterized protein EI90DRAFT_3050477 [Cantharellus anzutake]KAF8333971.1 hypothetical protein EI90DRAFT_3050477 [Cantharellus anzutake]